MLRVKIVGGYKKCAELVSGERYWKLEVTDDKLELFPYFYTEIFTFELFLEFSSTENVCLTEVFCS